MAMSFILVQLHKCVVCGSVLHRGSGDGGVYIDFVLKCMYNGILFVLRWARGGIALGVLLWCYIMQSEMVLRWCFNCLYVYFCV